MNNPSQRLSLLSTQHNKLLGSINIDRVLNGFHEPAILVKKTTGDILQANQEFCKIYSYSQDELTKKHLKEIIQRETQEDLFNVDKYDGKLFYGGQKNVRVMVEVTALDDVDDLYLLKILSEDIHKYDQIEDDNKLRCILEISRLVDSTDVDIALESALEIAGRFLRADFVTVYQAEKDFPEIKKLISCGMEVEIPDTLSLTDFARLSSASLWLPGKRAPIDLHKFAKSTSMSFMVSAPLGQEGAYFGLLVAGSFEKKPDRMILKDIDVLGAQLSNTISHFILKNNLNRRLQEGNFLLSVRNILTENIREGIIVLTQNLLVKEINPAAEIILGYTLNEVSGQPVDNILIGADLLPQVFEAARNGIITHDIGNVYLHHRSGQSFPAHIQVIPVMVDEDVKAIVTIVSDMSEKEQIQLRTRQLEHRALLGEFASVFAHEVRNPINNISTGLQLLSSRFEKDDPNQEVVERTQNDCVRLNHLMESFLSFSRPIDHSSFDRVNINQLIKRVMDRWQPRFFRVNIKPLFQPSSDDPLVYGDVKSLERVFINLISNAVDVMSEEGGTLALRIRLDNSIVHSPQVEITVTDSGPGIPDEIKNKIFEPFVTTKTQGTGLGLAITKHILTEHRGSIRLKTFTGGTVFHVYLPAIIGVK